jgi:alpha-D-ribose 1-methylphosphonate 5-triphosphate synthase subunit PhnH
MNTDVFLPGFADPVAGAQSTFRAVLDAMSRPGSVHTAGKNLTPPAPLDPATAAVLLALVDGECPVALDPAAASARAWIAFHCGAMFDGPARFALALSCPDFSTLPAGTHEAPEDSCTVILQVRALGTGAKFRVSGPGLRTPGIFAVDGLPQDFVARWQANHALFPRGVDLILCAATQIVALPRSAQLEEA